MIIKSPFVESLIQKIQFFTLNDENVNIIFTLLHIFSLLSRPKIPEFNDLINEKFIKKLIFFCQHPQLIINSLQCISNLIWISDFSFGLFYKNELFSHLQILLTCNNEEILILCALIDQRSLEFLDKIYRDYTRKKNAKHDNYEIDPIISNLSLIMQCPLEKPKMQAITSIPQIIQMKGNSLDTETVKFYLSLAIQIGQFNDTYHFATSIAIISEFIEDGNETAYEIFKGNEQIISILKKGLNYASEPEIQIFSIETVCIMIVNIAEAHALMKKYQIVDDIFLIANEGGTTCKEKVVEAICRIFYDDKSPLQEDVIQKGGFEFLCDAIYYSNECSQIVNVFLRITSKPAPFGPNCINRLTQYGLIEILEESIKSLEYLESEDKKVKDYIDNATYLKNFLLNPNPDDNYI